MALKFSVPKIDAQALLDEFRMIRKAKKEQGIVLPLVAQS